MTTAAIILAAGFSRRMGIENKLLMHVGGRPILRRVVDAVLPVVDTVPLIVLGHGADAVTLALNGVPADLVTNSDPARGQASSVHLGLTSAPRADDTLVVLADQPLLYPEALRRLLRAHRTTGGDRITVPIRGSDRGNPVVIPWNLRQSILENGLHVGCGGFTRKNPGLTRAYRTDDPAYFLDVDTPADLALAQSRAGRSFAL